VKTASVKCAWRVERSSAGIKACVRAMPSAFWHRCRTRLQSPFFLSISFFFSVSQSGHQRPTFGSCVVRTSRLRVFADSSATSAASHLQSHAWQQSTVLALPTVGRPRLLLTSRIFSISVAALYKRIFFIIFAIFSLRRCS
jgi:hypothetical protein